jgi:hypothetical protein
MESGQSRARTRAKSCAQCGLEISGKSFSLSDLFDIKKGTRLIKSAMKPGPLAFVSAIERQP